MRYTGLRTGKILDYGAGTGAFLDTCKKNKWDASGIEPDGDARKVMAEKFSISTYPSLKEASSKVALHDFDVIMLFLLFY